MSRILFIHGMLGSGWNRIPLLGRDYPLAEVDAPDIGTTPNTIFDNHYEQEIQFRSVLVSRMWEKYDMVIGHSRGGVVAAQAIVNGRLKTSLLITLGTPTSSLKEEKNKYLANLQNRLDDAGVQVVRFIGSTDWITKNADIQNVSRNQKSIYLDKVGHIGLLFSKVVRNYVDEEIKNV